jgi:hypothetical protein
MLFPFDYLCNRIGNHVMFPFDYLCNHMGNHVILFPFDNCAITWGTM